jgi:hypothetical protein
MMMTKGNSIRYADQGQIKVETFVFQRKKIVNQVITITVEGSRLYN